MSESDKGSKFLATPYWKPSSLDNGSEIWKLANMRKVLADKRKESKKRSRSGDDFKERAIGSYYICISCFRQGLPSSLCKISQAFGRHCASSFCIGGTDWIKIPVDFFDPCTWRAGEAQVFAVSMLRLECFLILTIPLP